MNMKKVLIVGAGPGGLYAACELVKLGIKDIIIFDKGKDLYQRICPMKTNNIDHCIKCANCSIMEGYGGAGAFSDGKFNITNDFGGTLYEKIGKETALELMNYVDDLNKSFLKTKKYPEAYSTADTKYKKICVQNKLHLMSATIRHLGTDNNYIILENMYKYLCKNGVEFKFETMVNDITYSKEISGYSVITKDNTYYANKVILAVGRSGSHWLQDFAKKYDIPTKSNRVDIGVRVEIPYEVFSHLTEELYESKIIYKTQTYQDNVRTFCMNPHGEVVSENTNGIITVNGHSYEDPNKFTENTNFALLVSQSFTEPFNSSNEYGESIAKLSNMLGGGVIVQKFGDLIRGNRTTEKRLSESTVRPTLKATPGDLSLVLPKRILDDITEMIYQLDKVAPGTANDDTLLYGVEVKFYNSEIEVDTNLSYYGLYIIGDGSGVTHSLSHAAASGIYVARQIAK